MIKIVKNNDEKVVTKGAYENFYKPLGYEIYKETLTKSEVKIDDDRKDEGEKKTSKAVEFKKR